MWLGTKSSISRSPRSRRRSRSRASAASPPRLGCTRVAGDREARAGDVLVAQVGQRLLELPPPLRDRRARRAARPRRSARRSAARPSRSPSRPAGRAPRPGRRRASPAGRASARQLGQPDAGVDLVERGIARSCQAHRRRLATGGRAVSSVSAGALAELEDCSAVVVANRCMAPRDDAGPAGLVAGAEAGAVVAVEVLVEQEAGRASAGPPGTSRRRRRPAAGPSSSRRKMLASRRAISSATW